MEKFYSKNKRKYRRKMKWYFKLIRNELEKETGMNFNVIVSETWDYYEKELLEKFPYIGGKKVKGTKNLTHCYFFIALGETVKKYNVSLEMWGYIITICYERVFERIPLNLRVLAGKLFRREKFITGILKKNDIKNSENAGKNPGSFVTEVQKPSREYPVVYYTRVCPIADFAEKYGYMEYMPYICNLDYVMFEALRVPFYREKTCAAGDGYCDFKLKSGAPVVSAWPCHGLEEKDPLK